MKVGVPKEIKTLEFRVGMTPAGVHELVHDGHEVIVETKADCYHALGVLHSQYPPLADRIKDYIATPKANMYQSLHTTVFGPVGQRMEVQIRTAEMHRVAEQGIAAHWKYKEGHLALSPDDVAAISRIRELFETARDAEDAEEFMETVKNGDPIKIHEDGTVEVG